MDGWSLNNSLFLHSITDQSLHQFHSVIDSFVKWFSLHLCYRLWHFCIFQNSSHFKFLQLTPHRQSKRLLKNLATSFPPAQHLAQALWFIQTKLLAGQPFQFFKTALPFGTSSACRAPISFQFYCNARNVMHATWKRYHTPWCTLYQVIK